MRPKICVWAMLIFLAAGVSPVRAGLVISQIYGGGGNSGATYKNDFIEIFNASNAAIDLAGISVQYASAMGSTWQVTPILFGKLEGGQYFLIQEAQGPGGTVNLPPPDLMGTISMSATDGKVALVNHTIALVGANPVDSGILDLVGYGTAGFFEGPGPAPALSNTTSALRLNGGLQDSNDNQADFQAGVPNPRNTASALNPPPQSVPEPSTLSLCVAALLSVLGFTVIHRRVGTWLVRVAQGLCDPVKAITRIGQA